MAADQKDFVIKDDHEPETGKGTSKKTKGDMPLPTINFSTFIFSLNSSALVQLGLINDPVTGEKTLNLPLAKQTIDIIAMLEDKTRGNLTSDEASMIKSMLYDLRMLYVKEKG